MKKHYQWTSEWEDKIIAMIGQEVKDLFKEIKTQKQLAKAKLDELNAQTGQGDELAQVYQEYDNLEKKLYLGDNATNDNSWKKEKTADGERYHNFLGDGSGTKYRTEGWKAIQKNYYEKQFAKVDGTVDQPYSNLYEYQVRTEKDTNKDQNLRITEQEVIKLLARKVKELQKIKKTDWDAFTADTSECLLPTTKTVRDRKNNKWNATTPYTNGGDLTTWMDTVRTITLTDNEIKDDSGNGTGQSTNGQRLEYSFKNITTNQLQELFNLIEVLKINYWNWQDKTKFKTAMAKIAAETTLTVLPAETEPVAESKLKEWGITGYTKDSNGQTNYYLTNYGTKLSDYNSTPFRKSEFSWDSQQKIKLEEGLQGWASLVYDTIRGGGSSQDWCNERKLMSSLIDDPVNQLLQDIANTDEYGRFGPGTPKSFTLNNFPHQFALAEKRFYELKTRKKSLLKLAGTEQEEIAKLSKAYNEAKTELTQKETELANLITNKLQEKRTKLKTDFKIDNTTAPNFGPGTDPNDNNRLTLLQMISLRALLSQIAYLEKFDDEAETSVNNENTARTLLDNLKTKILGRDNSQINHVNLFRSLGSDIDKAIETFEKEGKQVLASGAEWVDWTLPDLLAGYDELEKLIKLTDHDQEVKKKVKEKMTKQPDNETAQDWQDDPTLGTDFTDDLITKWNQVRELVQRPAQPTNSKGTQTDELTNVLDTLIKDIQDLNNSL